MERWLEEIDRCVETKDGSNDGLENEVNMDQQRELYPELRC